MKFIKIIKLKLLHHEICDLLKIEYVTVNRVSLLFKVKRIAKEVEKLNKYTNKDKLNRYFENICTLSRPCENDSREGMEEAQPLFREKTDELLKEMEKFIVEQNITIRHMRKEVAGLKDKIRSFNVRNVNRK